MFAEPATAITVRSISLALRTPNWAFPAGLAVSRRIAARVVLGAICLSSSSHFPLKLYSNSKKPVVLPPGRARLSTKPLPTGSIVPANTIGTERLACCNAPTVCSGRGQDHVRRERNQFRRVSANVVGIVRAQTIVDPHVAADGPAKFPEPLQERRIAGLCFRLVRSDGGKHADPPHALALLRARRDRPCCGSATEQHDEVAPFHYPMSPVLPSERIAHVGPPGGAALRDFDPARCGSFAPNRYAPGGLAMSALPPIATELMLGA